MRYWLGHFVMPKTTPTAEYLAAIVAYLQNDMQGAGALQIVVQDDGSIPSVCVDATTGSVFSAQLAMDANDPSILRLSVTALRTRSPGPSKSHSTWRPTSTRS